MNDVKRLEAETIIDETAEAGLPADRKGRMPGKEPAVPKTGRTEGPRRAGVAPARPIGGDDRD